MIQKQVGSVLEVSSLTSVYKMVCCCVLDWTQSPVTSLIPEQGTLDIHVHVYQTLIALSSPLCGNVCGKVATHVLVVNTVMFIA